MAAAGATVGPPAPCLARAVSSVMPKNGVSSAPEYVVGTDTWGRAGRSKYDAPGVPASCSVKKHTALPRSAHDPPPNDTTQSTPSRRACSSAACTVDVGTWELTPSNVDATSEPSDRTTPSPYRDDLPRPV